jgi:hypothetical protein
VLDMGPPVQASGGPEPDRREGASASPKGLQALAGVCNGEGHGSSTHTGRGRPRNEEADGLVRRELG